MVFWQFFQFPYSVKPVVDVLSYGFPGWHTGNSGL